MKSVSASFRGRPPTNGSVAQIEHRLHSSAWLLESSAAPIDSAAGREAMRTFFVRPPASRQKDTHPSESFEPPMPPQQDRGMQQTLSPPVWVDPAHRRRRLANGSWKSARSGTTSVSRRGVPSVLGSPWEIRASFKRWRARSRTSLSAEGMNCDGSSSVPISKRSSWDRGLARGVARREGVRRLIPQHS